METVIRLNVKIGPIDIVLVLINNFNRSIFMWKNNAICCTPVDLVIFQKQATYIFI